VLRHAVEDEHDRLSDLDVDLNVVYATSTNPSSTELSDSDNQTFRNFEYGGQEDNKEEELVPDSKEFVPQRLTQYRFVAREKLANLFAIFKVKCRKPNCLLYCEEPVIHDLRMCYSISFTCVAGHAFPWISGNLETKRHSSGFLPRLYSAIICAGLYYTQLREICLALGLYTPGSSHFYEFQRGADHRIGWIDAVTSLWATKKREIQQEVKEQSDEIVVYLDARFDSSLSGFHGTAPNLDKETGKIIEIVTHTREECGNSWKIEDTIIQEGLQNLQAFGLWIVEAIHDDKNSVDTILREMDILS
jgi:hypothetical protein